MIFHVLQREKKTNFGLKILHSWQKLNNEERSKEVCAHIKAGFTPSVH